MSFYERESSHVCNHRYYGQSQRCRRACLAVRGPRSPRGRPQSEQGQVLVRSRLRSRDCRNGGCRGAHPCFHGRHGSLHSASGNPGPGSKFEGGRMKTPVTSVKARVSASASSISAIATSQPRSDQDLPLFGLRTTARTPWPADSKARATAPLTLPVIPVIAYMSTFPFVEGHWNDSEAYDSLHQIIHAFIHFFITAPGPHPTP